MLQTYKPQKAVEFEKALPHLDFENREYFMSPKIDGIRVVILDGVVYSQRLKPIPSKQVQELFGLEELNNLEGEITVGSPKDSDVYNRTQSHVMSRDNPSKDLILWVFDDVTQVSDSFVDRNTAAVIRVDTLADPRVRSVYHALANSVDEIESHYNKLLELGYEGLMINTGDSRYKFGRATPRSQEIIKYKPFEDSEARIVGFECEYENLNEKTKNAIGQSERSSHKSNRVPKPLMGRLFCVDVYSGKEFSVAGFTANEKKTLWDDQDNLIGKVIVYKRMKTLTSDTDTPRHPTFKGFRDPIDMPV